ncbi:MAG TPA: efflux RND transporter periplasmic adaptor subunit, partial [Gammaproteobacteria bacterium]|nr:efflux RND transporter periplasmic adaptor subunit [Gammaproteobacteria bacterium]
MSVRIKNLFLLAAVPLLITACSEPPEAPEPVRPIKAIEVGSLSNIQRRSFPGEAKAAMQADMSFRIGGDLISLPVNVGDKVKQGDLLARLDPQDHQNKFKAAQANLERARANLKRSESDYKRVLRIFKQDPGATSQADIDRKRQQRDQDKANIKSSSAELANMQNQLDYTYLKAPFSGKIVATYVENHESVRAKQNIVRLLDASSIEMVVHIPENLIKLVKYVEAVYVVFDAFPDTEIRATVKEVGTEA